MNIFENKKKLSKWIIGIIAVCILIFLGVQNIGSVSEALGWVFRIIMPLVVGWAIAIVLNVPMRFLETHLWRESKRPILCKLRRPVAVILSIIFILGALAGILMLIFPTLIETVTVMVQSAIDMVNKFNAMSEEEILALPFGKLLIDIDWNELVNSLKDWIEERAHTIVNAVFGTVSSFVGNFIDLFVSVAFAIYILAGKERIKRAVTRLVRVWLPDKKADWLIHAAEVTNFNFRSFVSGQTIEAIILGVLCFIGMVLLGFPYAAMISTMVGVTALIPFIGGFIGGGIGAFMILTVEPINAIWFIIYFVILQQFEGNVIYPRVMGNRVNLSPIWVLVAVTIGGGIGGAVGMLLSVPLLSTICLLFEEETQKREKKKMGANPSDSEKCANGDEISEQNPEESFGEGKDANKIS